MTSEDLPKQGLNYRIGGYFKAETMVEKLLDYKGVSVWDENGGHIYHYLDRKRALILFLFKLFIQHHPEFAYFTENLRHNSKNKLKDSRDIIQTLTKTYIQYGNPNFNKKQE